MKKAKGTRKKNRKAGIHRNLAIKPVKGGVVAAVKSGKAIMD
jgi:hypothetical protein